MSTRVIDDPTALGWVLDPATGRYEWGGGSSGGGGGDCNIPILDSPPDNPELGEQWFSSTDGYLWIWYGAEWIAIGGAGGGGSGGPDVPTSDDPYWNNVSLLLNFDGVSSGTTDQWTDGAGKQSFTNVNGVSISDAQFKYGDGSALFSTNQYLAADKNEDLSLNADFTAECWFFATNLSAGTQGLLTSWGSGESSWMFRVSPSGS